MIGEKGNISFKSFPLPFLHPSMTAHETVATFYGVSLRNISLFTLAVQNSMLILMMRYSRTLPGPLYITSTAVLMSECLKFLICAAVFVWQEYHSRSLSISDMRKWPSRLFGWESDAWKLSVPALLYTIQNNLQYLAVTL
jgi:UDP-sugar transporter A1/2/3